MDYDLNLELDMSSSSQERIYSNIQLAHHRPPKKEMLTHTHSMQEDLNPQKYKLYNVIIYYDGYMKLIPYLPKCYLTICLMEHKQAHETKEWCQDMEQSVWSLWAYYHSWEHWLKAAMSGGKKKAETAFEFEMTQTQLWCWHTKREKKEHVFVCMRRKKKILSGTMIKKEGFFLLKNSCFFFF